MSVEVDEDPSDGTTVTRDWYRWRSDSGAHYATRTDRQLTDEEIAGGLAMTVHADTEEALEEELRGQADLLRE
jgi:hypothetical protein